MNDPRKPLLVGLMPFWAVAATLATHQIPVLSSVIKGANRDFIARISNEQGLQKEKEVQQMRRAVIGMLCLSIACSAIFGQAGAINPSFEVASVKPADSGSGAPGSNIMRGGPGTSDPGQISFSSVTMKRLLMAAYGVEVDRISGPGWLDTERYTIVAKVPAGTAKQQVPLMLQNLLAERFHLSLHRETKDFPGYELVRGKRGPKLKQSAENTAATSLPQPGASSSQALDKNGFPQPPPGRYAATSTATGVSRLTFNRYSISDFAKVLGMPLGTLSGNRVAAAVVLDKTGLAGKYDFTLEFQGFMGPGGAFPPATSDAPDGIAPSLFAAIETQLGLKLEEKKAPLDVFVIDHIDKAPTKN